ncbi:MAG TPA: tail fiber domain-containing protein [Saprospiraceae bacterium]|nr:tail fiber domain-containing protein [Saprospiraceae bacterium]
MDAHSTFRSFFSILLIALYIPVFSQGNVGVGTTTPEFKLTVEVDGGILAKGTFGSGNSLLTAGAGSRLIWYPKKAAFRSGAVDGTQWDDAGIGNYSFASGWNAKASGLYTFAFGNNTTASGDYSNAMGYYASTNNQAGAFVLGDNSTTTLLNATATNQYNARFTGGYRLFSDAVMATGNGLFFTGGNLGIGLPAPAAKLDVNGTVKISGQLTSLVSTGTAPFVVTSTTVVANLHAATADLAASATTATTTTDFSGTLVGDINGTQAATSIGTGKVTSNHILDGTIFNTDIYAAANIADTKLATISAPGKVSNSATTATSGNTPNAIVMRDASGNFNAGTIFGTLNGSASSALTATSATTATTATNFIGSLAGDITGTQNATVVNKLRNTTLSTTSPMNNQVLTYNSTLNEWEPKSPTATVSGTGTATRIAFWDASTNISSSANLFWDNTNSRLGIGTITPEFKLTLNSDGGIIAKGGYGVGNVLTTTGVGTRMIWYSKKAAFRAGYVNGNKWDDANIGDMSFASGTETKASGYASTAMGVGTTASGSTSVAMGSGNTASGQNSTTFGSQNMSSGDYSTSMGEHTNATGPTSTAIGYYATASMDYAVALGDHTTASGFRSTAMGHSTMASGGHSTALGQATTASGEFSTAMGNTTTASGVGTTAMGSYVSTNGFEGCVIMGDNATQTVTNSSANNQFTTRFNGGYRLYSGWNLITGVLLAPGGGSWTSVSDRNVKENFRSIDTEDILIRVGDLPLSNWNYKSQSTDTRHIGPMAQDFYAAFHLDGVSDTTINTLDIDGINMAAIQGLKVRTDELKKAVAELETLKEEVSDLKNAMAELKAMILKK